MNDIQVESGVPLPTTKQGRKNKYPWSLLKVGDSFLLPGTLAEARKVTYGLYGIAKKRGMEITIRKDAEVEGLRVWRVK